MHTIDTITAMFEHMVWADATVWTAVLASPEGREDAKLRGYLHHLHLVQWAFLRVWRDEARDAPFPEFDSTAPMMEWAKSYYPEARSEIDGWTDGHLATPQKLPWASMVEKQIGRPPSASVVGELAMQVPMHSQYHRGQVNARLREVGGEPPLVDYIAWVWLGKPEAAWPEKNEE